MRIKLDTFIIVFLYLSITHCFFLLPEWLFVFPIGKMYDVALMLSIIIILFKNRWSIKYRNRQTKLIILLYSIWILFCGLEFVNALSLQSLVPAIRGIRENFLFLILFVFLNLNNDDYRRLIKLLIYLEIIGALIYILQFVSNTPFLAAHYLIQKVGGIDVLRSYANIPLFNVFVPIFLLNGLIEKNYFLSRKKDIVLFAIESICIILHFQRSYYMCYAIAIGTCVMISKIRFGFAKKTALMLILAILALVVLPLLFPNIFDYIKSAFTEYRDGGGNGLLRVNAVLARYKYLLENNKLLCGLGTVSADYVIPGLVSYVTTVRINDIAYGIILIRYGIAGFFAFCSFWFISGLVTLKSKTKLGKTIFIYVISSMLLALTGEAIIDSNLILLGMLIGIWQFKISQKASDKIQVPMLNMRYCNIR